jgi:hypothetical protein
MRPKNRKWVAMAAGLYVFLMWSAYRWSVQQIPRNGSILEQRDRELLRRSREESEKRLALEARVRPVGETRLTAAGPAYVAARYDATHVVFVVDDDSEARFPTTSFRTVTPRKIPAPAKSYAPLAGLQELWEPDPETLHFSPRIIQDTPPGEPWNIAVSSEANLVAIIERPIIATTGCSLALGFLAEIPKNQQPAFQQAGREYFAVRRNPVEGADPQFHSHISELRDWKPSAADTKAVERQLNAIMSGSVEKIDADLIANAASPGATEIQLLVGNARSRLKEWIRADRALVQGKGVLDYDVRAFRLTPDGVPRLFVRARWKLANAPVFLMTAWFKAENPPVALSADASWSADLRNEAMTASLGENLDFETILNEFDADVDGWAELLVYSDQGKSTTMAVDLYTDKGLVPLKIPLRRDTQSPEACLDP